MGKQKNGEVSSFYSPLFRLLLKLAFYLSLHHNRNYKLIHHPDECDPQDPIKYPEVRGHLLILMVCHRN